MLCACLNVPETDADWQNFAWNSKDQIDQIRQAVSTKYGVALQEYVLYPFTPTNAWLQNNSSAHTDFCSVLGLEGHNLIDLNFQNSDDVASWINLCYHELFDASSILEI